MPWGPVFPGPEAQAVFHPGAGGTKLGSGLVAVQGGPAVVIVVAINGAERGKGIQVLKFSGAAPAHAAS
jgi:hypothetical protein